MPGSSCCLPPRYCHVASTMMFCFTIDPPSVASETMNTNKMPPLEVVECQAFCGSNRKWNNSEVISEDYGKLQIILNELPHIH